MEIQSDSNGNKVVVINTIKFSGKRNIDWDEVKKYLKSYVGEAYTISKTKDIVYIGNDFPNEYTGSKYTYSLRGTAAKAKANASQAMKELLETAVGKSFRMNHEEKHLRNAKYGWYRYESRFALPVFDEFGNVERYNVFRAALIIRHAEDEKMYLYDLLDIKKETSNPLG